MLPKSQISTKLLPSLGGQLTKGVRMIQSRSNKQFLADKSKGQKAEKTFMELIAAMGGTAQSLGTVPGDKNSTPRFSRPHATSEKGYCFSVSPDIVFTLPNQPKGFAALAQIKVRKVYHERSKGWLHIFLDESELHRMNIANKFYDVFFVIHLPELTPILGFHDWMWLTVDDLKETQNPLLKRKINGKSTYLIPLNIFQPLNQLKRKAPHASANSNFVSMPE